jgi:RNA polymerase sigma-70 factor (ECF subfamily)
VTDVLEQWTPRLYRFALRLTGDVHAAEDLTQDTLLRAWSGRQQLRDAQAGRVWLFRIAANLWRDQLRRARLPVGRAAPLEADCPAASRSVEDGFAEQEELQRALAALDALPSRQREVLYLHACEEMPLREIAEVLSISCEAARASLSLARKKLREQLTPPAAQTSRATERAT